MRETSPLEGLNSFPAAMGLLVYFAFKVSSINRCVIICHTTNVSFFVLGFIKFSGPYYILVITERRKIGKICCHPIYAITKNEMLPVQNSTVLSDMAYSMDENRRISELRKLECPKVLEDVMYILIVFSEIGVHLVLKLSNCMYNGRLEIWPHKDWELESIQKVEVL
ncbi:phosphoinositide phosphatase SAC2-like [Capsicum galapagoense]